MVEPVVVISMEPPEPVAVARRGRVVTGVLETIGVPAPPPDPPLPLPLALEPPAPPPPPPAAPEEEAPLPLALALERTETAEAEPVAEPEPAELKACSQYCVPKAMTFWASPALPQASLAQSRTP